MRRSGVLQRTLAGIALLFVGVVVACNGNERPPPLSFTADLPEVGPPYFASDAGEGGVPRCGLPTPNVCDCVEMPLATDPPNIYFVLDHSGSMAEGNLWKNTSLVVLNIVRSIGNRANFGAAMFPSASSSNSCATGVEIMSTRAGDAPGTTGPTWTYLHDRTIAIPPSGGTPLASTLASLTKTITSLPGKTFVVLATDGGPNCSVTPCSASECILNIESVQGCTPTGPNCCADSPLNCLDATATRLAVSGIAQKNVPVYVVGVPGSAPYASLLDDLADRGGTAQVGAAQKYYRVDTASESALSKALRTVAAKIVATCEIDLTTEPTDPNKVNVYLDEVLLPKADQDGWIRDGKRITLTGTVCERVKSGEVLDVRVIAGCPTVNPN